MGTLEGHVSPVEMWTIIEAHRDADSCVVDLVAFTKVLERSGTQVAMLRGSSLRHFAVSSGSLHCLPDTVDPRGPKGR